MKLTGKDLLNLFKKQPVGCTCALVCIGLMATLYLRWDAVDAQEKLRNEKRDEATRLKNNKANAANLPKQLEDLTAVNKAAQERAVQPRDTSRNLQYFYKIEADAGVKQLTTRNIGIGAPAKGAAKSYVADAYVISVVGDFRQSVDFLRRIERGPRFSRITSAIFAAAKNEAEADPAAAAKLSLTLNVELLGLAPPAPPAPPAPK